MYKRQLKTQTNNKSKDICYESILQLYDYNSEIILYLIKLDIFSEFGYYKDYFNIWKKICQLYNDANTQGKRNTIYEKYNMLIKSIIDIINNQRNYDLKYVDRHIKNLNISPNLSMFGIDSILNDSNPKRIDILSNSISYLKNNYSSYDESSNLLNIINPDIQISKVSMWIPRENKNLNKEIFWFKRNNIIKKIYCFDMLVSHNKISNKICDSNVYSSDRKRYRIENSILNVFIGTPQVAMCKNSIKNIDFEKVGSRFIHKNKNYLLNKPVQNSKLDTTTAIKNMFKSNVFYYKNDRIQARNNLIKYFINKKNNNCVILKKEVFYVDLKNSKNLNKIFELDIFTPLKHYIDFLYSC